MRNHHLMEPTLSEVWTELHDKGVLKRFALVVFVLTFVYILFVLVCNFLVFPRYKVPEIKGKVQKYTPTLSPKYQRPAFSRGVSYLESNPGSPNLLPSRNAAGFYQQNNNSSRFLRRASFGAEF